MVIRCNWSHQRWRPEHHFCRHHDCQVSKTLTRVRVQILNWKKIFGSMLYDVRRTDEELLEEYCRLYPEKLRNIEQKETVILCIKKHGGKKEMSLNF